MLQHTFDWLYRLCGLLTDAGWNPSWVRALSDLVILLVLAAAAVAIYWLSRVIFRFIFNRIEKRGHRWGKVLMERKTLNYVCYFVLLVIYRNAIPAIFAEFSGWIPLVTKLLSLCVLYFATRIVLSILWTFYDLRKAHTPDRTVALKNLIQFIGVVIYFIAAIIAVSILVNKSPLVFVGGLSAASAVLMLVFKDSLMGLVAGVQIQYNDLVRIGDWITMPGQGADGDVIDISLTTVKVRNFDLTVVSIPTYMLISQSVQNWRGIRTADSRRIQRQFYIDITSVRFCTPEMFADFRRLELLSGWLDLEEERIKTAAKKAGVAPWDGVNAYCPTNADVLVAYIRLYLNANPHIRQDVLATIVRQLPGGEQGLPVEIYCYSDTCEWAGHEAVSVEVMNHILAVIPFFHLSAYQRTGQKDTRVVSA